jgi:CubicO group peptidase (beta-lactamase class C family)
MRVDGRDRVPPATETDPRLRFPTPRERRLRPDAVYRSRASNHWFMQHVREVLGTASIADRVGPLTPLPVEPRDLSAVRLDGGEGPSLPEVLERTATDAFVVLHRGAIVDERYFNGMTAETPHMWQSVSKSLASCVAGNLVARGVLDLQQPVAAYVPELAASAYGDALVEQLLDMSVGIDYSEDYADEDSQVNELDRIYGVRPARSADHPGSSYEFATRMRKLGDHGREFAYVSLNVNALAWVMERATGNSMPELIRAELWSKLGGEHDAYIALDAAGSAQSESAVCSSVRDLARFGLALAGGGVIDGRQAVPGAWIEEIMRGGDREAFARALTDAMMPGGSYRRGFWVSQSADHTVFMGLGIYGQFLYVDPRVELVVAKFSTQATADDDDCWRLAFALGQSLAASLG